MATTAFIVLLLCFAVSRLITSRSVSALSVEQKAMLVDVSASKRPWFFVALAALVIVLLVLSIPMLTLRLRRLSALGLPAAYMRGARLSSVIVMLGLVILLGAMVYNVLTFVSQ